MCKIKHHHSEAKKASDGDADGLEKQILLAGMSEIPFWPYKHLFPLMVGLYFFRQNAKVMLTCNLWTAKGNLNIYNLVLKNV